MQAACLLLTSLLLTLTGYAQTLVLPKSPAVAGQALSPRNASYQIKVTLDVDRKRLSGREILTWRNPSPDPISELRFHLYLNAFRDGKSTFMRESGGQLRGVQFDRDNQEDSYGSIDIVALQVAGGENLTKKIQFTQPDDLNKDDRTVIRVPLATPVAPGQTIVLNVDFRAKLPKIFARTGFSRDYFLVGQWFPKMGVYETAGTRYAKKSQWNCHQFHANSEFYADYGVYDVAITTPQNYQIGATGLLRQERTNTDGTKTQQWHAEDVVDFAWTASPHFQVIDDQWKSQSGHVVKIRLLMQPEHAWQAQRHVMGAKTALAYFDKHLGQYPFPNLTIVDPPFHGAGSGGMEYPTFITAGTFWFVPDALRAPEATVVHEFGHQYFMQLLASNEFEEAWLDEGFNQYYEGRIMDEAFGPKASSIDWLGYRKGDAEESREGYVHLFNPGVAPTFGNAWQLPNDYYGELTYYKTATWLRTLEGLVGRPVLDEIMQTYFIRWRFKHPCATDFIAIVNEIVPKSKAASTLGARYRANMNWFFDQVLYGDQVCDYALRSVQNKKVGNQNTSIVRVDRLGSMKLPVQVLVHFDNGREKRLYWDGQAGSKFFTLTQPNEVLWAKVDPDQKLVIDTNLNNNSFTTQPYHAPEGKYAVKLLFWVQNWMQWLAWLA